MRVELYAERTVEQNASHYFEKAKKLRKKLEGAKAARERALTKLESEVKDVESKQRMEQQRKLEKLRKKQWYEKYRWFTSSDGYLVIGGRDADTNEEIVKKHMSDNDLVFHTEAPGSPFVIVKNEKGQEIPDTTRQEAAAFGATYSNAWKQGLGSIDVFEVRPEQVSKQAQAGEYMKKGSFMIRGERKTYKPRMSLAIGILEKDGSAHTIMAGPETAVSNACGKYIILAQGDLKKNEAATRIMKKLGLASNDQILSALPAGEFKVVSERNPDA